MIFDYTKLTRLHIELSNLCNAACPFCPRNLWGGPTIPNLKSQQISASQFKEWFPERVLTKLESILFCGSHGDPMMASDVIEIVDFIQSANPKLTLHFNTNGGMRNSEFWFELGKRISKDQPGKKTNNSYVAFSIDGLEDTNHLYRRNVKWDRLINNARAFIKGGGLAVWEFLVFKHNQHQIDMAKNLSQELGFERFFIKKALGFEISQNGSPLPGKVIKQNGEFDYFVEAPTEQFSNQVQINILDCDQRDVSKEKINVELFNNNFSGYIAQVANFNSQTHSLNSVIEESLNKKGQCIKCKALARNELELFIRSDGTVMPCCYLSSAMVNASDSFEYQQTSFHFKDLWDGKISLNHQSIEAILNSELFDRVVGDSWRQDSIRNGKLAVCVSSCGEENKIDAIARKRI